MAVRPSTEHILRTAGVRPTPRRLKIFDALAARDLSTAEQVHTKVKSDLVTVYRTLEAFVQAGLVREVRFKDGIVRYEVAERLHHHHIVCTICGHVDELPHCDFQQAEQQALTASKRFARIEEHTLEFFGTCVTCAKG